MASKTKAFDVTLYLIPVIFVITSVAVIYSLFYGTPQVSFATKQAAFAAIGLVIMVITGFSDYRFFRGTSWIFYLVSLFLLLIVGFAGKTVNGAMNWLDLGFFQLQPSEVAKIATIFLLSSFLSKRIGQMRWIDIGQSLILLAPALVLIVKEPDLGTALVVVFVYLVLLFMARLSRSQILAIVGLIIVTLGISIGSVFKIGPLGGLLKDYQRSRILVFIDPEKDPLGRGYNVRQAQIAVGSGGLLGKGLGRGSQSQLQFLPEPHTDFIFAGIAEAFGFAGSTVILLSYLFLLVKIVSIAHVSQDNFGMLLSFGVAAMIFFQVVINVGMNLGVAPVTGIPLPLLSSGGTSMLVTLFMLGLTQSVFMRHKKISF